MALNKSARAIRQRERRSAGMSPRRHALSTVLGCIRSTCAASETVNHSAAIVGLVTLPTSPTLLSGNPDGQLSPVGSYERPGSLAGISRRDLPHRSPAGHQDQKDQKVRTVRIVRNIQMYKRLPPTSASASSSARSPPRQSSPAFHQGRGPRDRRPSSARSFAGSFWTSVPEHPEHPEGRNVQMVYPGTSIPAFLNTSSR